VPLELGPISQQVDRMIASFVTEERRDLLGKARELLRAVDADKLRAKVRDRLKRFPWLVAIPVHTLSRTFPLPVPPTDFSRLLPMAPRLVPTAIARCATM